MISMKDEVQKKHYKQPRAKLFPILMLVRTPSYYRILIQSRQHGTSDEGHGSCLQIQNLP